jgi:streptomycin 3"-adenylyltransferase
MVYCTVRGMVNGPQSWMDCDEEIRRYVMGLVGMMRYRLDDNLAGVYLHGSLAMGSYFPPKSDIDLIIVVYNSLDAGFAGSLNRSIAEYAEKRPTVGSIELSIITHETAQTVPHQMPYELHYSEAVHRMVLEDRMEYSKRIVDPDLPAHLMCVRKRGVCLYGKPVDEVFGEVDWQDFMQSVLADFDWIVADENICGSPYYSILNICRVLQMLQEHGRQVLSKYEGGLWGIRNLPQEYAALVEKALEVYMSDKLVNDAERKTGGVPWDRSELLAFRDYARNQRRDYKGSQ